MTMAEFLGASARPAVGVVKGAVSVGNSVILRSVQP